MWGAFHLAIVFIADQLKPPKELIGPLTPRILTIEFLARSEPEILRVLDVVNQREQEVLEHYNSKTDKELQ